MAHFAQLDQNNVVVQVIVVDDKDAQTELGIESEEVGILLFLSLNDSLESIPSGYRQVIAVVYVVLLLGLALFTIQEQIHSYLYDHT
jgi:hypothetical protein